MNGKERILTALEVREPDCVPLYIHGINEAPIIGIGKHLTDSLPEPQDFRLMNDRDKFKLVDTLFMIHEHFDIDGITTFEIGHEEKVDDLHVKDGFGVVYKLSEYGIPVPVGHPVKTLAELKNFTPPVPRREDLGLLDLAVERFKGQKATFWLMRGVFVRSWRLIGMTNYMMNVYTDPEFLHLLAKMMMEYSLAQLDLLLETGYDGLNPLEPQAGMAMKKVKDYCGDKICLLGNIDCVDLLPKGNPKQVEQAVIQTIEDGAAGGGLIICSSNSLHQGVNPENAIAMFKAVRKHGQYKKAANIGE